MKTKSFFLSAILIFAFASYTNGQIGGYLKSKVDRAVDAGARAADKRVNQEIDKKAEEEVNKAADKVQHNIDSTNAANNKDNQAEKSGGNQGNNQGEKTGDQGGGGFNLGGLMGGGPVTSKYRETYSFNSRIFMQAEMYDGKDVVKMDYYIYFSDAAADGGVETKMAGKTDGGEQVSANSSFIFDGTNKSFLMLTDMGGTKFGIISDIPDETTGQSGTANTPKTTMTKTGNSKVIAGYKCDEYKVVEAGKKEYNNVWVTKDLKLKADKRAFSKTGVSPYYDNPELRDATTLAMESYDDKCKLTMKSETKEINLDFKHTMSPTGYPLRQMNFNQTGTK
ncbi:MAG: DUF4412 domain-containing protein [Bacteroidia bacterium]|nr:DUF4412 domain-containing protein [Bacteroidia bacterium]